MGRGGVHPDTAHEMVLLEPQLAPIVEASVVNIVIVALGEGL